MNKNRYVSYDFFSRTDELEKLKSEIAKINSDLDVIIRTTDLNFTSLEKPLSKRMKEADFS